MHRNFDPQALAALNAEYSGRLRELWAAAQASGQGPGATQLADLIEPNAGDRRFAAREWTELPYFSLLKQSYLLACEYATKSVRLAPLPEDERQRVAFATRQALDALSPTNFLATNPEVIARALKTEGASVASGAANLAADARKGRITMTDESAFEVGRNIATTPGQVVLRNDLVEVIQYAPSTPRVRSRPLVIVPPCINKYYILDLSPENSFVRHAVAAGHTVFIISWRNIPSDLGRLTWDDYIESGALTAIRTAKEISGSESVNVAGFCVGGTLLACALAVLAARGDRSVASATFLTTLLDFADPGEIGVFVSRQLLAARAPALLAGDRLRGRDIAAAFASLRANELVWNYVVGNYLKGQTPPPFDLLYWNSDSANLPGPMYVYYLQNMYLDNRLRERGALTMAGESIDLSRIDVPTYVLAARDDHIVPWKSAWRSAALLGRRPTFVLGASGHIAGVINPPADNRRHYWVGDQPIDDAEAWLAGAQKLPGSWWSHWTEWLAPHGGRMRAPPEDAGSARHRPLGPAPGRYVLEPAG